MKLVVIHAREVGDFGNLSRALSNLGVMAKRQLLDDDALALYQESIAAARAGGSPNNLALVLWNLGGLHLEQGDYAQAERVSREALELWRASGSQWGIIGSLESHAEIALAREMAVRAARLAAAAGALRERISVPVQPIEQADYDRFIEDLRAALGDRFESVWAAGAALTVDEAVAEALESGTNATAPGQTG